MLRIHGGNKLNGTVHISGSKNSALAIIVASVLCDTPVRLCNVPLIDDVFDLKEILSDMGCTVSLNLDGEMLIDSSALSVPVADSPNMATIRAGSYFLGALLGRFGHAEILLPGGCKIGSRPLDFHINAFGKMNANLLPSEDKIILDTSCLTGAEINLPYPSVGATVNIMLAAVKAQGTTVITNCAREPHVTDVASFLSSIGARIEGIGSERMQIHGVGSLRQKYPHAYPIISDQIEAGTYMIYACMTNGDLTLKNAPDYEDMATVINTLTAMGAHIRFSENDPALPSKTIHISAKNRLKAIDLITAPHPAFPTDLQAVMCALLSMCEGVSTVTETVFENRLKHAAELSKMGAKISVRNNTALIEGVERLSNAELTAHDLRGGAALVGAAMSAEGWSTIYDDDYIRRGYQNISAKLNGVNAQIVE